MEVETNSDFATFLDQMSAYDISLRIPQAGEFCKGIIVSISDDVVLVDIGAKSEGIISQKEIEPLADHQKAQIIDGNEIPVVVLVPEDDKGNIVLSYAQALTGEDWERAQELQESGEVIECEISGHNRGGLLAKFGSLRAFIPISQIGDIGRTETSQLVNYVGQVLPAKVVEADPMRKRLILSCRESLQARREEERRKMMERMQEGDRLKGRIVNIQDFGLFVDIGGIQGLVHSSEVSWDRIGNLKSVFHTGQEVEVMIIQIDNEKGRVSLSIKRLSGDPWDEIETHYKVGQLIESTITKVVPFGAFARLSGAFEVEGLIHISELSDGRVTHPHEVVKSGEETITRIIKIDKVKRQIGLSLKQVSSSQFKDIDLENMGE